jgi:hypothetical protein
MEGALLGLTGVDGNGEDRRVVADTFDNVLTGFTVPAHGNAEGEYRFSFVCLRTTSEIAAVVDHFVDVWNGSSTRVTVNKALDLVTISSALIDGTQVVTAFEDDDETRHLLKHCRKVRAVRDIAAE